MIDGHLELSMDSERGYQLFNFDRPLMEYLVDGWMPISQT